MCAAQRGFAMVLEMLEGKQAASLCFVPLAENLRNQLV
jgi:hypothetical protein